MSYREQIKSFILDSEDDPSMEQLITHFRHLEGEGFAEMFMEMLQMRDEAMIAYDPIHDCWLWIQQASDKQKERML